MDHFELVSEYKPTGDQPQAIKELVEEGLSYQLMRWSIYLNEFGTLQGNRLLNFYDQLSKEKSNFAKKLLKLFVYEHYFVYGSTDVQMRQRIWEIFKFNKKQESRVLLGQLDK